MNTVQAASPSGLAALCDVLDSFTYAVFVLDGAGNVAYVNSFARDAFNCDLQSAQKQPARVAVPSFFGDGFARYRGSDQFMQPAQYEEHSPATGRWFHVHACPSPLGLIVSAHDVTTSKANSRILVAQRDILEMVASAAPLEAILDAIAAMIESQSDHDDLCSILLLSSDGKRLHLGTGGSLPNSYNVMIDGFDIGAGVGSCGTAAFTRQRVVVADIARDPLWKDYATVALGHGLRACWSQPILSREGGQVLGTVANYSRHAGAPPAQSLLLLETAARLAQIAIEQARR